MSPNPTHPLTASISRTAPTDGSRLATLALTLKGDTTPGAEELRARLATASQPLRERLAEAMRLAAVPTLEEILESPALQVGFSTMGPEGPRILFPGSRK